MTTARALTALALAGLVIGPLAWALNTEIGTFLPGLFCRSDWRPGAWAAALALGVALAGVVLSWRGRASAEDRTRDFLAMLGALTALLFALPLALQLLATLVLSGCES